MVSTLCVSGWCFGIPHNACRIKEIPVYTSNMCLQFSIIPVLKKVAVKARKLQSLKRYVKNHRAPYEVRYQTKSMRRGIPGEKSNRDREASGHGAVKSNLVACAL